MAPRDNVYSVRLQLRKSRWQFLGWLLAGLWPVCPLLMGAVAIPESPALHQLGNTEAKERIANLRAELARHDELYFKKAAPEISDAEYDRLKRELIELEKTNPEAARDATGLAPALGDDRSGLFPTYRHLQRMLSLGKSYAQSELRAFDAQLMRKLGRSDLEYMVEPKFDGLAISVTYEKGRFVRAVTRGDGVEGDDVTADALTIRALPRALLLTAVDGARNPVPELIELRGEIYLPHAEFARINREREAAGEEPYAHPRNLAAGTLKQLDAQEVARRKLAIVFYGWGACLPVQTRPDSQQKFITQLRAWGLPTIEAPRLVHGFEAMWRAVEALARERKQLSFPVDGAVVKLNSVAARQVLGETEQVPNWAMAYKYKPDQAVTRVRGITIRIGRTGVLTPVAELEPVKLGGSIITRATLHNRDEIQRRDIRIGDYVQLEKAGEIIPAITAVETSRRTPSSLRYVFPDKCPVCQAFVVNDVGEAAVRCPNMNCSAQVQRRIEYFASKACVDISGLGPATIKALVERGLVHSVADLYRLRRVDLMKVNGVGEKKADRLLAEIERSRTGELWRFINGLGIPQVGPSTARVLAVRFGSLEALARCSRKELLAAAGGGMPGLGVVTAESILTYFERSENRELVVALLDRGVTPKTSEAGG